MTMQNSCGRVFASVILLAVLLVSCVDSPRRSHGAEEGPLSLIFRNVIVHGTRSRYAVVTPEGYASDHSWPAILFLHGSGECGNDGVKPTRVGLPPAALAEPDNWPFIIIIPQKPDQESQWIEHDAMVMAVLDDARREYSIDPTRLYLSGLSQGGAGTWAMAAAHLGLFAAIAPVCGYGDAPMLGPALRDTPVWAFHGEKDDVVPPEKTRSIIAAIKAAGGSPQATYFPEANHNSWEAAYSHPQLPTWMLRHSTLGRVHR